jgi:pyridoxamine 5'-phosphate oxidase
MDIKALRREYASRSLDESATAPDPIQQFRIWFDEALRSEVLDANAMALATVAADGTPSARTVLLKEIDDRGLVFFTHYASPKGEDLAVHPQASVLFYWAPLERQVRVTGSVERVDAAASDAYFASRPRDSQIAAWAARQSSELPDRATLERRYQEIAAKYDGQDVPRPPDWGGYRVMPHRMEFWQGRPKRLHDRIVYVKSGTGWQRRRLAP